VGWVGCDDAALIAGTSRRGTVAPPMACLMVTLRDQTLKGTIMATA